MLRAWPLVVVVLGAACINYAPPEAALPSAQATTECHLAERYDGLKMPGVTNVTILQCVATNAAAETREVCAQPYVGVRQTGALYTSHQAMCSGALAPGASESYGVTLDMHRDLCGLDRGGCIVKVLPVRSTYTPDPAEVVAMARGLERIASSPGRDRATTTECDALIERWRVTPGFARYDHYIDSSPDDVRAFCIGLSRVQFDCLRLAPTEMAADLCSH